MTSFNHYHYEYLIAFWVIIINCFLKQNGTLKIPIFEIDKGTTSFFRNESAYSKILNPGKLELKGENIKKKDVRNDYFFTEIFFEKNTVSVSSYYNGWKKKHLMTMQN